MDANREQENRVERYNHWFGFHRRPLFYAPAFWSEPLFYFAHLDDDCGMGNKVHPSLDCFVLGDSMGQAFRVQIKEKRQA